MTGAVQEFVKASFEAYPDLRGMALEVGSLNVNGTLRGFIPEERLSYFGIDRRGGKNVDWVGDVREWVAPGGGRYQAVICVDTIEHDPRPHEVVEACRALLARGGLFILCAPMVWNRHEDPVDYYRFMPRVFSDVFLAGMRDIFIETSRVGTGVEIFGRAVQP